MTTPNQAREAVYAQIEAVFSASAEIGPNGFAFDNEAFTPPPGNAWARVAFREALSAQGTLGPVGGRRFDRLATLVVEIHTPNDIGTQTADALVKLVRDNFEGVNVSLGAAVVHFTNCQVQELGIEGAEWRVNALAQCWFEESK